MSDTEGGCANGMVLRLMANGSHFGQSPYALNVTKHHAMQEIIALTAVQRWTRGRRMNIPVNEQETVINFTGGSGN